MSRHRYTGLFALCLAFLPGLPVRGEPREKGSPTAPAAIVAKAIQARGGEAALARFPAVTWKGSGKNHVRDKVILSSDEGAEQLPERMWSRSEVDDGGTKARELLVVAGDHGWTVSDGKTEMMSKEGVAEQRERMYAEWLNGLTPLNGEAFRLKALGESRVGDRAVVGILVSREGHRDVRLFFAKESGLLVKRENRVRVVATGRKYTQEVFFGRYREVGGVQYPTHLVIRAGDELRVEVQLAEIKPCRKLDEALFIRPKD